MLQRYKKNRGLTLIEIMVTLAIIAIISAIALPAFNGYLTEGRKSECNTEVAAIMLAESQFFLETNGYFGGGSALILQGASGGYYIASSDALAAATNCVYSSVLGAGGTSYTLTATGAAKLVAEGVITTKTIP